MVPITPNDARSRTEYVTSRVSFLAERRERRPRSGSRNRPRAIGDSLAGQPFGDSDEARVRVATVRVTSVGPPILSMLAGEKVYVAKIGPLGLAASCTTPG